LRAATASFGCATPTFYEWVEGMIVRTTVYADIDEARAAAERLAQERANA
jgi:hypothetical protein